MIIERLAKSLAALAGSAFLFPALANLSVLAEEKPPEPVTVKKVVSAKLMFADGSLTVIAVSEVPTAGFTKPTLTRVTYFKRPDDGIQDYTFRALPPDGVAAQVISQVEASDVWKSVPVWVKGVRIHGAGDGVLVKMLGDR